MPDHEHLPVSSDLHLDQATRARLQQLAATRHESPDALLHEAVVQYVDREERRQQFERDALESWRHYQATGLHVTEDEVFAWFRRLKDGEDAAPPPCHT